MKHCRLSLLDLSTPFHTPTHARGLVQHTSKSTAFAIFFDLTTVSLSLYTQAQIVTPQRPPLFVYALEPSYNLSLSMRHFFPSLLTVSHCCNSLRLDPMIRISRLWIPFSLCSPSMATCIIRNAAMLAGSYRENKLLTAFCSSSHQHCRLLDPTAGSPTTARL